MNHPSIEPRSKAELAKKMNISLRTLQRRLKEAGLKIPRGHIPPDLQQVIFKALGWTDLARNGTKWRKMAQDGAKSLKKML